jgi:hypothetical protein
VFVTPVSAPEKKKQNDNIEKGHNDRKIFLVKIRRIEARTNAKGIPLGELVAVAISSSSAICFLNRCVMTKNY